MPVIKLVIEFGSVVAAIIPERLSAQQLNIVYGIVRGSNHGGCFNHPELATRWNAAMVVTTDDWAKEQLHRVPMSKPKSFNLQFVS